MSEPVHVTCVVEPAFAENAFVVWRRDGGKCWVIDPGLAPSASKLLGVIAKHRLTPEAIVLTHAHADHIAGIPEIFAAHPDLPVYLADGEAKLLVDPWENMSGALGLPLSIDVKDRRDVPPGSELTLDGTTWRVLDVAGHSPAGRAYYCAAAGLVINGDALFAGGVGRTDFHHSDPDGLMRNIRTNLFSLPPETVVYSGHGPATTIGEERRSNPFVGEAAGAYAPGFA